MPVSRHNRGNTDCRQHRLLYVQKKSAYMKAAQERIQARQCDKSTAEIPTGTMPGIDVMAPASAGLLQSTESTVNRVCFGNQTVLDVFHASIMNVVMQP